MPSANRGSVINLDRFKGVDFRTADTQVSPARSPYAINMIAGENVFYPQKRNGYKRVVDFRFGYDPSVEGSANANGLHMYKYNGSRYIIAHFATRLYSYKIGGEGDPLLIYSGMADSASSSFVMDKKLYLLDGAEYYCYDGVQIRRVSELAFVPTTSITCKPSGGGVSFEAVNLLSPYRKNSFAADGTSKAFFLDTKGLDSAVVTAVVDNLFLTEGAGFTVDRAAGVVNFNTAPAKFAGADNVVITFARTVAGYGDRIKKCRICGVYGGNNDSRVFLSGNPDYPNMDFSSGLYDPTYFPDLGYTKIGSDNSPIVGYQKQFGSQLIIKGTSSQDAVVYLRNFALDDEGRAFFPVTQGISGVGCIAPNSISTLEDLPLFLTADGVYSIMGTNVSLEKTMQNRSAFVDGRLLLEPNLQGAVSTVFEGKYYLCLNDRCYVADSRQKNYDQSGDVQYEWYYWENIPAKRFLPDTDRLYFATNDGRLMRFYQSNEVAIFNDDGAPIRAVWRTPYINLGALHHEKIIKKIGVVLQPFIKSSCLISYMTDRSPMQSVFTTTVDIFEFNDIDFNRFSFNTFSSPSVCKVKINQSRVILVSIELSSDKKNEGFGIYAITAEVEGKI